MSTRGQPLPWILLAALGLALALTSCGTIAHATSASIATPVHTQHGQSVALGVAGCQQQPPTAPGTTTRETVRVGALQRAYWLHIPAGHDVTRPLPLVLSFHGHGSSGLGQQAITGFSSLADRVGFLVVYPQGTVGPDGQTGWATGPRKDPTVSDISFVSALITRVESTVCVDPTRIYATGFSNGGAMSAMLACTMASRIAAVASVSGSYFPFSSGCHPARAVALLEIHGTADSIVPYQGSPARSLPAIPTWLATWAQRDGCKVGPTVLLHSTLQRNEAWTHCSGNVIIMHDMRIGGGHVWPRLLYVAGSTRPQSTAEVIWTFLRAYSLMPSASRVPAQTVTRHSGSPGPHRHATPTPPDAPLALVRR